MRYYRFILILVMFSTPLLTHAAVDSYPDLFTHLTVDDGLSQGFVSSIVQDREGFIWISTLAGLNRYDGRNVTIYTREPGNLLSLPSNQINSQLIDSAGHHWLATEAGLSYRCLDSGTFNRLPVAREGIPGILGEVVTALAEDPGGRIWVRTPQGVTVFRYKNGIFRVHSVPEGYAQTLHSVRTFYQDPHGLLWLGLRRGSRQVISVDADLNLRHYPIDISEHEDMIVVSFLRLKSGRFIAMSRNRGLLELDERTGRFNPLVVPGLAGSTSLNTMYAVSDGTVILATDIGTFRLDSDLKTVLQVYRHNPLKPHSICTTQFIRTVFEDSSGLLWFGSAAFGISTLSPTRYKFSPRPSTQENTEGDTRPYIQALDDGPQNTLFVLTKNNRLLKTDTAGSILEVADVPVNARTMYVEADGSVWVGGVSRTLVVREAGSRAWKAVLEPDLLSHVAHISPYSDDALLVSVPGEGLQIVSGLEENRYTVTPASSLDPVLSKAVDLCLRTSNRALLLNLHQQGILYIPADGPPVALGTKAQAPEHTLLNDSLLCCIEARDGNLWLGTRYGLHRLDPFTLQITAFTTADGLPDNVIYSIEQDLEGYLWLGTNRGLAKFNPFAGNVLTYRATDGLQSNEFNIRASCLLPNGYLAFGGVRGFNIFDPAELPVSTFDPPIVITRVTVGDSIQHSPIPSELVLKRDSNAVLFEVAALDYNNPAAIQYAFLLEGFDTGWRDTGSTRRIGYSLSPGTYTLRVKATNSDGQWGEHQATMKITVQPHFFETTWFQLLIALIFLCLLSGIYFWRTATTRRHNRMLVRLNSRLEEQMSEIQELNTSLSTFDYSISNALRVPLRQLGAYSEILQRDWQELPDERRDGYLRKLQSKVDDAKSLIDSMLQLSRVSNQALHRSHVDLGSILKAIINERTKESSPLQCSIEEGLTFNADLTMMQYLLTELLDNSLQHSGQGRPQISLSQRTALGRRILCFSDNGKGIAADRHKSVFEPFHSFHTEDTSFAGNGLGLTICHRIIQRHRGSIWLEETVGGGLTVCFTLGEKG